MIQPVPRYPTVKQLTNAALSGVGIGLSRLLKRPMPLGMPVLLMVEPGTACQLKCPHCPTGRGELTRATGRLTLEKFCSFWDTIQPAPIILQLWNQGEPFTNRETPDIIRHAASTGTKVKLSTNVELLANPLLAERVVHSGLYELILSLDGTTQETHVAYRAGGKFEKVRQGVQNVVEAKKRLGVQYPIITWQFILFRHNLREIKRAKQLAAEWGCERIVFKTAQLEDLRREEGFRWLPRPRRMRRYDYKNGRWVLRRHKNYFCSRIFSSAVVQWDGEVVPCCFDKDAEFVLGNVIEEGFPAVWKNAAWQQFRKDWIAGKRPPMCDNCTEGLTGLYTRF